MNQTTSAAMPEQLGATERRDLWWLGPVLTIAGLSLGFGYLTWAAFLGDPHQGHWGPYLSPVYSPPLLEWFPSLAGLLPDWFSPALLILWAPGGFRATCYYYRKAYYRAAFLSPPACGVQGVPTQDYKGEKYFPFIMQNAHRFFMYLAVAFIGILWFDVYKACWFDGHFGVGLGTLVLAVNALFLGNYTFGCHSLRHLVGGKLDCFACSRTARTRYFLWSKSTVLNEHHMLWALCSLTSVCSADLYVRLVSSGVLHDLRIF